MGKVIATLLQGFILWALWFVADRTELPFIVRCVALFVMLIQTVAAVQLWTKK